MRTGILIHGGLVILINLGAVVFPLMMAYSTVSKNAPRVSEASVGDPVDLVIDVRPRPFSQALPIRPSHDEVVLNLDVNNCGKWPITSISQYKTVVVVCEVGCDAGRKAAEGLSIVQGRKIFWRHIQQL